MKLRVFAIGADKSGLFEPAAVEYAARLKRYGPFELVELPPSKKGGKDALRAREEEGEALLAKLSPRDQIVVLDERGKEFTTDQFCKELIVEPGNRGRDVAFLIGGAEGHSDAVRAKASPLLALSKLTLPHRLARVVLLEQLYRAYTIVRGEPYHK